MPALLVLQWFLVYMYLLQVILVKYDAAESLKEITIQSQNGSDSAPVPVAVYLLLSVDTWHLVAHKISTGTVIVSLPSWLQLRWCCCVYLVRFMIAADIMKPLLVKQDPESISGQKS
jgi:hypothetical protein